MRVISQDGKHDFPYENVIIKLSDDGFVFANFVNGQPFLVAQYSSPGKADKAMLLLHRIYVKAPLENEAKQMGEFVRGTFKAIGTSGYVEPESNSFVFRFPQEDEI